MKRQYDSRPTHFICHKCGKDEAVKTQNGVLYRCPRCQQRYQMVSTKYGFCFVIIGGKVV